MPDIFGDFLTGSGTSNVAQTVEVSSRRNALDPELRREYLSKLTAENLGEKAIAAAATLSDGFSFAQLREAYRFFFSQRSQSFWSARRAEK
jgi:hypothetical protein